MKKQLLSTFLLLLLAACQRDGSAPAIRVTLTPAPTQTQGPTSTYNVVTLVAPTRAQTRTQPLVERPSTTPLPLQPTTETTGEPLVNRPLLIPRLLQANYTSQATRLEIGFDIHPAYRGKPGVYGEIYDATLTDQNGREIAGVSTEMTGPEKATLEFTPLPAGVTSLSLQAELALRRVPAQAPLAIDVSGHTLDQPWPIQVQLRFGNVGVQLHTARLYRKETGAPPNIKQQFGLELRGDSVELNGAQLICIELAPLPPPAEGNMGCSQESGKIESTVSLGPAVNRSDLLPMPVGLVLLEATGDFMLPGYWETTWTVEINN